MLGIITARGGSKGIPQKNIKLLAGKPLIAWTIEAALKSPSLGRLIVSTDDLAIAEVCRNMKVEVPFIRPSELAQDQSSHISVIEHALDWLDTNEQYCPDYIMLLQPTSPLRQTDDIEGAIKFGFDHKCSSLLSVCEASHHPWLAKIIQSDGRMTDFLSNTLNYQRRQDFPEIYVPNGAIYFIRRGDLLQYRSFVTPNTIAYKMPTERSLDIDTPWDFYLANLILNDRERHGQN